MLEELVDENDEEVLEDDELEEIILDDGILLAELLEIEEEDGVSVWQEVNPNVTRSNNNLFVFIFLSLLSLF